MKRTPLKRRSKATDKWMKLYLADKALRIASGYSCQHCCTTGAGVSYILDGHHYAGSRKGPNILRFIIACRACHDKMHSCPNGFRALGLLAEINGTFSVAHPAVVAAEKRFAELMEQLTEKEG